jgi:hypothetical protein
MVATGLLMDILERFMAYSSSATITGVPSSI